MLALHPRVTAARFSFLLCKYHSILPNTKLLLFLKHSTILCCVVYLYMNISIYLVRTARMQGLSPFAEAEQSSFFLTLFQTSELQSW